MHIGPYSVNVTTPSRIPFKGSRYTLANCPIFWDHFRLQILTKIARCKTAKVFVPGVLGYIGKDTKWV
jgi:hypothetical protein